MFFTMKNVTLTTSDARMPNASLSRDIIEGSP